MKIELLITEGCPFCREAEQVWRIAAAERQAELILLDVRQQDGLALTHRLMLNAVPAVLIDGILKGIGVQALDEARRLLKQNQGDAQTKKPKKHTL